MIGLKKVLPNRMYMNFKYFTFSRDVSDYSFDTTTYGIGLNYQLIDRGAQRFRLFKWSGLSIGSGFLHNTSKTGIKTTFSEYISDPFSYAGYYAKMGFTPETAFEIDTTSNVIPVDISTSLRLLWILNLTLGGGVDFTLGKSKIAAHADSVMNAYISDSDPGTYDKVDIVPGTGGAVVDAGTKGKPELTHFRLMAGVGICLGPVPVDVKANWYPVDHGASVNVSTGVVW